MDVITESLNKKHNRANFDCGNHDLNNFLKKYARQNQENNVSKTFVATSSHEKLNNLKSILGYYTLTSGQVNYQDFPNSKHPKYPVAIARLARLAVDKNHQSKGLGGFLLFDALQKINKASELIGIYAIVVDAKNEKAKSFYKHFGFIPLQASELTLFLPMSTISKLCPTDTSSTLTPA